MGEAVDDQVVARAQAGDERAWRALVTRHVGLVYTICRLYGMRGSTAADVNQVVWLRLVEHLPRIRTPEAVSGWLAATTRAECLRPRRVSRRVTWAATKAAEGEQLIAAFLRIGVRCQRLLRLAVMQPRPSNEEISAALAMEVNLVESTCARCVERLSRALDADATTLLSDLERMVDQNDHVPPEWERAGDAAFGWLSIDAPLAERVYDSTSAKGVGRLRGGLVTAARRLRFAAGQDGVEVALDTTDDEVLLTGHVLPNQPAEVKACWPGGEVMMRTRSDGLFRFDGLPFAPLSLHVDGDRPLKTGWVVP